MLFKLCEMEYTHHQEAELAEHSPGILDRTNAVSMKDVQSAFQHRWLFRNCPSDVDQRQNPEMVSRTDLGHYISLLKETVNVAECHQGFRSWDCELGQGKKAIQTLYLT